MKSGKALKKREFTPESGNVDTYAKGLGSTGTNQPIHMSTCQVKLCRLYKVTKCSDFGLTPRSNHGLLSPGQGLSHSGGARVEFSKFSSNNPMGMHGHAVHNFHTSFSHLDINYLRTRGNKNDKEKLIAITLCTRKVNSTIWYPDFCADF